MASDQILLRGITLYGHHGRSKEEQIVGQLFQVDLIIDVDLANAGKSDNIDDTVNYSQLFRVVKDIIEGTPRHLIETVAEDIASKILEFPLVERVTVRVTKSSPPIEGAVLQGAAVEIHRTNIR